MVRTRHEVLGIGRHIMQVSAWLRLVQSQFIAIVNLAAFEQEAT
jgi:hypothetical protein